MSTIDTLLRLVPDRPESVLLHLRSSSEAASLAATGDFSGYTLLHAAASYGKLGLLRALVREYGTNVNIVDSEGETPLFAAETEAVARCLIEELGADATATNEDGITALDNARINAAEDGGTWTEVVNYLENTLGVTSEVPPTRSDEADESLLHPPPLPEGVRITGLQTVPENDAGQIGEADPEFRRRIEELAAREDFHTEEGQRDLRRLVEDAIGGMSGSTSDRDVRRRTE